MIEQIEQVNNEVRLILFEKQMEAEAFRLKYLSRKGLLNEIFENFKKINLDQKKQIGLAVNQLKGLIEQTHQELLNVSKNRNLSKKSVYDDTDLTLPPILNELGTIHPLSIIKSRIIEVFARMGFTHSDGPEIEKDFFNFTALNFPENHPAREMQDTFYISKSNQTSEDILLRTHTSNVQVRMMQKQSPPIRSIMAGRVFRNEVISARAHCQFHQVEGLYVDKDVSFKDLKDTLLHFAKEMFGAESQIRLRPSYFPFTEPSAEIDVSCFICKGEGCKVCKHTGWVEIAGSGMVDPYVLQNVDIDPDQYTGFAFGMGIERIAMLKYGISDLRLFFENDIRFLRQFKGIH